MMKQIHYILFIGFLLFSSALSAQKQLAITMDDPNTSEAPLLTWQERNDHILQTLDKHKIKAALFVCGKKIDDANGRILISK